MTILSKVTENIKNYIESKSLSFVVFYNEILNCKQVAVFVSQSKMMSFVKKQGKDNVFCFAVASQMNIDYLDYV